MKKKMRLFAIVLLVVGLLSTNVFAADNYMPSVESQAAPEVAQAVITDQDGKEVSAKVEVTPYSEATAESTEQEVSEALVSAMDDIQKVDSVAGLTSVDGGTIKDDLQKALDTFETDYTVDDLVVRDLFDVSIVDENGNLLVQDGTSITLTFNVTVQSDEILIVLHNPETGKWEVIDSSKVKINDDGTVDVTLDSLSPIAFLTVANDNPTEEPGGTTAPGGKAPSAPGTSGGVKSPQTGESVNCGILIAVAMLLAAAGFCSVRAKRYSR